MASSSTIQSMVSAMLDDSLEQDQLRKISMEAAKLIEQPEHQHSWRVYAVRAVSLLRLYLVTCSAPVQRTYATSHWDIALVYADNPVAKRSRSSEDECLLRYGTSLFRKHATAA